MTPEDFIRGYLNMQPERNYNPDTLKLLAGVADQTKDGSVMDSSLIIPLVVLNLQAVLSKIHSHVLHYNFSVFVCIVMCDVILVLFRINF